MADIIINDSVKRPEGEMTVKGPVWPLILLSQWQWLKTMKRIWESLCNNNWLMTDTDRDEPWSGGPWHYWRKKWPLWQPTSLLKKTVNWRKEIIMMKNEIMKIWKDNWTMKERQKKYVKTIEMTNSGLKTMIDHENDGERNDNNDSEIWKKKYYYWLLYNY